MRVVNVALCAVMGLALCGCGDDDDVSYSSVDGLAPVITLTPDHVRFQTGHTFYVKGVVSDADGLRSITLKNEEMHLDKTIDLLTVYRDSLIHEYNLNYSYSPDEEWAESDQYNVDITVTDVVGKTASATLLVTPDGDDTAPEFDPAPSAELSVLQQDPVLSLETTVKDNKLLKYVVVDIPGISVYDSITVGNVSSYTLSKQYTFPNDKEDVYEMRITACDQFDNATTVTSNVTVSGDYPKMFLFDFDNASYLTSDLFGVPMLIDHTGKNEYRARYYNQKAGTGIRFLPSKTALEPICFGVDPENSAVLTNDPAKAQPIVLNDVGYYEITFNSMSGEYEVKTYTPTSTPFPQGEAWVENGVDQVYELSLAGAGLPGVGNWSTADPYILTPDADNPYFFYAEMDLTEGTVIEFTITPKSTNGWWPEPFWRFEFGDNDSGENEYNTKNNGNNMTKVTVKTTGKYRFEFDTELLRSRFYPVN